jgi:hypothetical protein
MAGNDIAVLIYEDWICETKRFDGLSNQPYLRVAMRARIPR